MKQISFFSISLILTISLILNFGCRKGKEDPFLSFRSREQRLIGKWELKEEKIEYEYKYYFSTNYQFRGTNYLKQLAFSYVNRTVDIDQNKYTIRRNSYTNQKFIILYGDTINIQDSLITLKNKHYKIDTIGTGEFKIILEIKKNNELIQYNNINLNFIVKDTCWGIYSEQFDCDVSSIVPCNNSNSYTYSINNTETSNELKWKWNNSKKTSIDAGYMKGKILRLAYNEIIIEEENYKEENTIKQHDNYIWQWNHVYCFGNSISPHNSPIIYNYNQIKKIIKEKRYQKWERIKD